MDKLRRDYSELAAKETVSQYLVSDTIEQAVVLLTKLHLVVELIALSQIMVHSALATLTSSTCDQAGQ